MSEYDNLIEQYKEMHVKHDNKRDADRMWFPGKSVKHHLQDIKKIVDLHNAKTLLDYGCGQGLQYSKWNMHNTWGGILPTCYDPAVEQFSEKPIGKFDGVINTDVMEHIAEEDVEFVFKDIFSYADKFVYFSIALFLAKEILPDGRNAHVTVKPIDWWMEKLEKCNTNKIHTEIAFRHTGTDFTIKEIKNV